MNRCTPVLTGLLLASLALGGCSSDDGTATDAPGEAAATEDTTQDDTAPDAIESAADQAGAASDAKQVAIGLETYYMEAGTYPSVAQMESTKFVQSLGVTLTKRNEVVSYTGDSSAYSLCIAAAGSGAWALLDSTEGLVGGGTSDATCTRED